MRLWTALLGAVVLLVSATANSPEWRHVLPKKSAGISGMVYLGRKNDQDRYLVVHDNKNLDASGNLPTDSEPRVGLVEVPDQGQIEYKPLKVTLPAGAEKPGDLEALTAIPETHDYLALGDAMEVNPADPKKAKSKGDGHLYRFHLDADEKGVTVTAESDVPKITLANAPANPDYEGLSVAQVDGKLVIAWAERTGFIGAGILDAAANKIGSSTITHFAVTWPVKPAGAPAEAEIRPISDLKIDPSGAVFVSSAYDAGDAGPFDSAVFLAGRLKMSGSPTFEAGANLVCLFQARAYKIEAIEFAGGNVGHLAVATDDEDYGSYFYSVFGR